MDIIHDQKVEFFQGDAPKLEISLFNPDFTVFKLVFNTSLEVQAIFTDSNGAKITKIIGNGVTVVDAEAGEITVELSASETSLLAVAENQSFYIRAIIDGKASTVAFLRALTVYKDPSA